MECDYSRSALEPWWLENSGDSKLEALQVHSLTASPALSLAWHSGLNPGDPAHGECPDFSGFLPGANLHRHGNTLFFPGENIFLKVLAQTSSNLGKRNIFHKTASLLLCQHCSSLLITEAWYLRVLFGACWPCLHLPELPSASDRWIVRQGSSPRGVPRVLFAINYSPLEKCEHSRWA